MRMMKRLAVCVLAAAMSLAMLTACGGDTPSAPETPSNPGTSQGRAAEMTMATIMAEITMVRSPARRMKILCRLRGMRPKRRRIW